MSIKRDTVEVYYILPIIYMNDWQKKRDLNIKYTGSCVPVIYKKNPQTGFPH